MIGDRRAAILALIIDYYIKTGEPIGSKNLCQMLPYTISSATIRNEMNTLGSLGFLEQRHTSGGRVPTKVAYRYYIDNLVEPNEITYFEKEKINEILSVNASDPERLLNSAANLLSSITGCASFYSTIKDPFDCVQGVELIPAGNNKAMIVMLTLGGKIKSSVITLNAQIDDEFKKIFYWVIKQCFIGTSLEDVNLSLVQSASIMLGSRIFDMLPIFSSLCSLCEEASKGTFELYGETKLLMQKELGSGVYNLLLFLAQKDKVENLLVDFAHSKYKSRLYIGDENPVYELRNTSMFIEKFRYNNNQLATLGILGSIRLDYNSIMPRVEYIMKTVSDYLKGCDISG